MLARFSVKLLGLLVAITVCASPVHALRSTKQQSFTDPDYLDYQPRKIVVLVIADSFEARTVMEEQLVKKLSSRGLRVYLQKDLFPPTRDWTESAQQEVYERESIESGIMLVQGASASSVIPIATRTYSSGNVFGNYNNVTGNLNAHGSSGSTTYNIMGAKSEAGFSAVMLDLSANRVAWYVDIYTKAGGTLFVGSKGDAKAAVRGLVRGLTEDGHIPAKSRR